MVWSQRQLLPACSTCSEAQSARADFWVRGHLGVQELPGEPQTSFAFGEINPDAENTGKGGWQLGNSPILASSKPFVTSVSPLAHGRGGAGEVRTSLQEHWRAWASPVVQTMLGTALSVMGGNGPWNLLSVPQCRASWIQESHTVSCSEWSLWCLCWFSPCPD